jgi:hypothetical protein
VAVVRPHQVQEVALLVLMVVQVAVQLRMAQIIQQVVLEHLIKVMLVVLMELFVLHHIGLVAVAVLGK